MSNLAIKEMDFVTNESVRSKYLERVSVLDRVKEIITLPNTDVLTTKQVAEYYEVTQEVIRDNVRRNREEFESNGMVFKKYDDIKQILNCENISHLNISRQGTNIFTKRALLNVGMLLRDSEIAKLIRSALLDIEESSPNEQKILEIDKEKELTMQVVFADSQENMLVALRNLREYKDRHIQQLENQLEEQKPKVEGFDQFLDTDNLLSWDIVAKNLGIGRNTLLKELRKRGVLMTDTYKFAKVTATL